MSATPPRILMSQRDRSAEIVLTNQSANILEVSTELGYTIQYSDSLGNSGLHDPTTDEETQRRCDGWLRIFPSRFSIPPNSSRTVRILLMIPSDPEEGEYWARLRLTGTPTTFDIATPYDSATGITTRIRTSVELDLPVIVRVGAVTTAITYENIVVNRNGRGGFDAIVKTVRTGNAAYRGTMYGELLTAEGAAVATTSAQFTTEFASWRSLSFPSVPSGDYVLRTRIVSVKQGSAMDVVIPSPTVEASYHVRVSDTVASIVPTL